MDSARRTGLRLAASATVLWVLVVAAFLSTGPNDGVPIGAGLLYLIAVPLSVMASAALISSLRPTTPGTVSPPAGRVITPIRWVAVALAAVSVILLPAVLLLGPTDLLAPDTMTTLQSSGIGAFVVSSILFALLPAGRT
ncbi:MAG: hypothetical protein ACLGI3_06680 [Actinomycetes bacterium]